MMAEGRRRKWDMADEPETRHSMPGSQPPLPLEPPPPLPSEPYPGTYQNGAPSFDSRSQADSASQTPYPNEPYVHPSRQAGSYKDEDMSDRYMMQKKDVIKPDLDPQVHERSGESYVKMIDINDVRNRYLLTRADTQKDIMDETGSKITTRGKYYPDRKLATKQDPALHLVVTCKTLAMLESVCAKIRSLLNQQLETSQPTEYVRPKRVIHEARLPIGLENTGMPMNQIRGKIVGPSGANIKYIQQTTNVKVQLRGRGSGYKESGTGVELNEPCFVHFSSPHEDRIERARHLFEDLLKKVREEVEQQMAQYREWTRWQYQAM